MTPIPTEFPDWATDIVPNGINGQLNVIEPDPEKKLIGWTLLEKPNRQYTNWLFRNISQWIRYLNDNLDLEQGSVVPVWSGLTNQPSTNVFNYSKIGSVLTFSCHIQWTGNVEVTPLIMTNLPFVPKNIPDLLQTIHVARGNTATILGGVLSGLINENISSLRIITEDTTTGMSADAVASGSGQLIISGSYIIEQ